MLNAVFSFNRNRKPTTKATFMKTVKTTENVTANNAFTGVFHGLENNKLTSRSSCVHRGKTSSSLDARQSLKTDG